MARPAQKPDRRGSGRPSSRPEPRRPRPRRSITWRLMHWMIYAAVWGSVAAGLVLLALAWDLPPPSTALRAVRRPSLTLADDRGTVFATVGDLVGAPMRLSQLPAYVPEAVVAVEDRRYWEHGALDPIGILRAMAVDLVHMRIVQGGSTIAQQVAKNLFLTNARTWRRKAQELLLTLWLGQHFTRREILEIWLNRVYYGAGAWGIDAAAHLYFGVPASHLLLWQAAVLAGLPRAPSYFSPKANPAAAAARGREVLAAMVRAGYITAARARRAARSIAFPPPTDTAGWFADWAVDEARRALPQGTDAAAATTLDAPLQASVDRAVAAFVAGPARAAHASEVAVVVMDAATGAVRAMVGGRPDQVGGYNRAVWARRQAGSTFKPFVWLAALEAGVRPGDMVLDAPIRRGSWHPHDFEPRYQGNVTVETALARSLNTAAVRLERRAGGPQKVIAVARRLGIRDKLPSDPSIALGTGSVGLLEMCGAYAAFFNGGYRVVPHALRSLRADGRPVALPSDQPTRAIDPNLAAMMVRMMVAVVTRGTARAAAVPNALVAGKTGTSENFRDAWFIGALNGTVIGVWVGNDDNAPMLGVQGGTLPAELFHQIALSIPGS
ncbi:MAG: transglycosylase domain-containing protein [Rhodospirillales bacterium]|nr:transglycosylase domain-containing protein [Rhodospirillales bacterium]